jgi:hypothetical protein
VLSGESEEEFEDYVISPSLAYAGILAFLNSSITAKSNRKVGGGSICGLRGASIQIQSR